MTKIFSLMLVMLLALPAGASIELEYQPPPKMETEYGPPVIVVLPPARPMRFRDKHPVIWKAYRASRHACVLTKPFVEVGGAVAQIVLVFI